MKIAAPSLMRPIGGSAPATVSMVKPQVGLSSRPVKNGSVIVCEMPSDHQR